jgi:hypothetical protein
MRKKGRTPTQFAMAWMWANQVVTSVIAARARWNNGTITSVQSARHGPTQMKRLVDSLVQPGHPSTPGYNDPQYPFYGRVVD